MHKTSCRYIQLCIAYFATSVALAAEEDPYLWLENVQGEDALGWVQEQNERTFDELRDTELFEKLYSEAYAILTSDERLPEGSIIGEYFYSFWQDEVNVRGVWRRAPLEAFRQAKAEWETVLDIDELEGAEHQNWVYQGNNCLGGTDRCLIELSRGGKDESVYREFSLSEKTFVDEGFLVPEAKSNVGWIDHDTLLVATRWEDDALTDSGYPLEVRILERGAPLAEASTAFRGDSVDTLLAPAVYHNDDRHYPFVIRLFADWNERELRPVHDGKAQQALPLPLRFNPHGVLQGKLIVSLEEDWEHSGQRFQSGDVIAYDLAAGSAERVFAPSERQAVQDIRLFSNGLFVSLLDNVVGRVKRLTITEDGFASADIALPDNGVVSIEASSSRREDAFVSYESAVQPTTLYHVAADDTLTPVAALPEMYDAGNAVIEQRFAQSADGTRIPYFLIGDRDVLQRGDAPTILYGYGGFTIPILPVYYANPSRPQHGALAGRMWLSRGGVLAIANLRGGGEFGPDWHQAALRENRQRAYDDYFAIAEDLIERGVTSSDKLGALGRSNGGLLLGVALTQRPDLFAALDIGVPLLDMIRYNKLLAGASWMGEYGNPDVPEDREFIERYSPYQNLEEGVEYPKVLFYTSTLDDRVHPGHARKMAAKLAGLGQQFFYYENIEGGHGGTANQDQLAMRTALEYAYFVRMLMPGVWDSQ
ncbi:MAG: prolyl oligopeptidase family serine peptidase [Pseudomonadota bacterium]